MSEVALTRLDLAQVGTTKRNCLKVVPVERVNGIPKTLERIVVGSVNGSVVCLFRKRGDTQVAYKTPPGKAVEVVALGGAVGSVYDKVFVATDNAVRGISKKGKHFFAFETNMAEPIRRMFIYGVEMVTCGSRSYTHYHDCQETNHVMVGDDILDIVCLPGEGGWVGRPFTSVIACNDATIKVIESSKIDYEIALNDTPVTLALFMGDGGHNKMHVLYGTKTGKFGLVNLPQGGGNIEWEMATTSSSAITCITCYAFTGPVKDVILGKEDGKVEIYNVENDDKCVFRQMIAVEESITSISCGRVSSEHFDDIVVCTYTGWVFALTRCPDGSVSSSAPPVHAMQPKMQQLKNEVAELEQKVLEERHRYTEMIQKDTEGATASFVPFFQVHDSFELNKTTGHYVLGLQLVLPIEMVIIMSEIPLKLIDVEKNSAVLGYTQPENENFSTMVTYRCQSSQTRIEICLRVDEGQSGGILLIVLPIIHPTIAQFRRFDLKPLCLHVRIHTFDSSRPLNTLSVTGQFTVGETHAWLSTCLDGIPSRPPVGESATYAFQCLVDGGSELEATASRGSLSFRSDSLTTIATLRELMTRETTSKNVRVSFECKVNEGSLEHSLRLLHPKMARLHDVHTKCKLAQALKELEESEADLSFLSSQDKAILNNYETLMTESEADPIEESPLLPVYDRLLLSRWKLEGGNATSFLPALRQLIINDYSLEELIKFYNRPESYVPKTDIF